MSLPGGEASIPRQSKSQQNKKRGSSTQDEVEEFPTAEDGRSQTEWCPVTEPGHCLSYSPPPLSRPNAGAPIIASTSPPSVLHVLFSDDETHTTQRAQQHPERRNVDNPPLLLRLHSVGESVSDQTPVKFPGMTTSSTSSNVQIQAALPLSAEHGTQCRSHQLDARLKPVGSTPHDSAARLIPDSSVGGGDMLQVPGRSGCDHIDKRRRTETETADEHDHEQEPSPASVRAHQEDEPAPEHSTPSDVITYHLQEDYGDEAPTAFVTCRETADEHDDAQEPGPASVPTRQEREPAPECSTANYAITYHLQGYADEAPITFVTRRDP